MENIVQQQLLLDEFTKEQEIEKKARRKKDLVKNLGLYAVLLGIIGVNLVMGINLFRKKKIFSGLLVFVLILPISILMTLAIFMGISD